jgi:hypothetical protein
MAGYIGSKASVTQVDGYTRTEADAEFVQVAGDTMTGDLSVTGTVKSTVSTTGDNSFQAVSAGGGNFRIYPDDATTANPTWLHQSNSSEDQAWSIGGVERMRLEANGTLTATDVTLSSGALNGVTSSDTFKRVVQAGVVDDFTDYTTTTTSAYAASGPYVTITPQSPGNTKLIGVFSVDLRSSVSAATMDAGTLLRLRYYNGSSYVNTGGARGPLIASNLAGNATLDDEISIPFQLSNSARRSDTGDWLIRAFFSCTYANNSSTIYTGSVIFWEVDT